MPHEDAGSGADTPTIIELSPDEARRVSTERSTTAVQHRADKLLQVRNLTTHFFTPDGVVQAVDDVSFDVDYGETLGLVGESGCGKSVTALSVARLVPNPPGRIVAGEILFDGINVLKLNDEEMRKLRGKEIGFIFQDPLTSLNPPSRSATRSPRQSASTWVCLARRPRTGSSSCSPRSGSPGRRNG